MLYKTDFNEKDCIYILDNLREADRIEAQISGDNWKQKLFKRIFAFKERTYIGKTEKDDIPVLMFGVCPSEYNPNVGTIWLLSTDEIKKHKTSFIRQMFPIVEEYNNQFYLTFNLIYKKNFFAKRWLKKVGYRFPEEIKEKNEIDKVFAGLECPENFEFFYRKGSI